MLIHLDCQHYQGDRPCRFERLCEGCPHYAPTGPRVLIVKLGALGDVVRTACLLPALAERPDPPSVTWLTSAAARPLVERMPGVDRVMTFGVEALVRLDVEQFDMLICLDKDPAPCAVAMRVQAPRRLGIGLSRYGVVEPLNTSCHDYFRLGLDNEAKFRRNTKTYPNLIYDALEWPYEGQGYRLEPTEADRAAAAGWLAQAGLGEDHPIVVCHPGAGGVFANKAWPEEKWPRLIAALRTRHPDVAVVLTGGPGEHPLLDRISKTCGGAAHGVFNSGANYGLGELVGLIDRCRLVVAGDTLAMHLAVALERRVVAMFGPTCPQEIDLFGLGEKIATAAECAPCYRRVCDRKPSCQDAIDIKTVYAAVERQLAAS